MFLHYLIVIFYHKSTDNNLDIWEWMYFNMFPDHFRYFCLFACFAFVFVFYLSFDNCLFLCLGHLYMGWFSFSSWFMEVLYRVITNALYCIYISQLTHNLITAEAWVKALPHKPFNFKGVISLNFILNGFTLDAILRKTFLVTNIITVFTCTSFCYFYDFLV